MARIAVAFALLQLICIVSAQNEAIKELMSRPAVTIEELMLQQPELEELFQEERRLIEQNPTGPVAITIGDSITAYGYEPTGWVTLLKQDYPMLFVNKGVGMGNTRSSLILSQWALTSPQSPLYGHVDRLQLVTFCFGANDAAIKISDPTWRFVPEAEYKQNLITSIQMFRAQGVKNFLLLTPPPAASPPRIDRRLNFTEVYAGLVKEVGQEMRVPVVNIFHGIQAVPEWRTAAMLPDGLHLGPVGNRVVYDGVRTALRKYYPNL